MRLQELAGAKKCLDIIDFQREVVERQARVGGWACRLLRRDKCHRVMVRRGAEKNHTELVTIGHGKAHDIGPKFCGPLNVTNFINEVPKFANLDGRCFISVTAFQNSA